MHAHAGAHPFDAAAVTMVTPVHHATQTVPPTRTPTGVRTRTHTRRSSLTATCCGRLASLLFGPAHRRAMAHTRASRGGACSYRTFTHHPFLVQRAPLRAVPCPMTTATVTATSPLPLLSTVTRSLSGWLDFCPAAHRRVFCLPVVFGVRPTPSPSSTRPPDDTDHIHWKARTQYRHNVGEPLCRRDVTVVRTRDGGGKVRSTKGGACEERARERVMGQGGVAVGLCDNRHRVHQQRTRPTHPPQHRGEGGRETVMMRGCVGCFATTTIHTHTDGDRESMYIYIYI